MKKVIKFIPILFGAVLLVASCSSDTKEDAGYIKINGTSYLLTYGIADDYGTNSDISYRNYWIRFQSSEGDEPSHFFTFKLYSTSTTKIGEGTYTYEYFPSQAGEFSWVKTGYNIQYDDAGEQIAGTILLDSQVEEGSMVITKEGDTYKFDFNIVFIKNNNTYTVTGEFKDILHDGSVNYSDMKK